MTLININTAINLGPAALLGICGPVSACGKAESSIDVKLKGIDTITGTAQRKVSQITNR